MTAYTARNLSTNALYAHVTQTAHGFSVGECVINAALIGPPNYIPARASTVNLSFGVMMVSQVDDADNFWLTQCGYVSNMTYQAPYTAGGSYYLSPTSFGQITLVPTVDAGYVYLPCFKADTTTSGYFFGGMGFLIPSGGLQWVNVTTDLNPMVINTGYLNSHAAGTNNLTLPTVSAVGDVISVTNILGNFVIKQNANQQITLGNDLTSVGVGGSVASMAIGDSIELLCITANLDWQAINFVGNFTTT